jgi:hydrogenase maturation protease
LNVKSETNKSAHILVLGIGNVLMGDEGVGVHVLRKMEVEPLPKNVRCVDGGTGSFLLLEPMQEAASVVLIDATVDGNPPGTLLRLTPRYSSEYPVTLTAHDIGLKDLLDVTYLMGGRLDVTLFTISIAAPQLVAVELSPSIAERVDAIAGIIRAEVADLSEQFRVAQKADCHA